MTLNNGVEMPLMLFGTGGWNSSAAELYVRQALRVGFPGVDTAKIYMNLQGVGRALSEQDRTSYFLTSKVGGLDVLETPLTAYRGTLGAANGVLKKLSAEYVDLMLLHYPPVKVIGSHCKAMQQQWRALEDFYKDGKARAIGVSNYCQADLECVLETATVTPAVNQVIFHVGMGSDPGGLRSFCHAAGIATQAFSPLGPLSFDTMPPRKKDDSLITGNLTNDIGRAYSQSGAQVSLRWLTQRGIPLNTRSSSEKHLLQDLAIFEFNLTDADLRTLDATSTPTGKQCVAWDLLV